MERPMDRLGRTAGHHNRGIIAPRPPKVPSWWAARPIPPGLAAKSSSELGDAAAARPIVMTSIAARSCKASQTGTASRAGVGAIRRYAISSTTANNGPRMSLGIAQTLLGAVLSWTVHCITWPIASPQ